MQSLDSRLRELEERFTGFSLPQQPPGLAPLPALPSVSASGTSTGSVGAAATQLHGHQVPEPSIRPADASAALAGPSFRSWANTEPPPPEGPQIQAQQAPAPAPALARGGAPPQLAATTSATFPQQPALQLSEATSASAQLRPLPQRAPTPSEAPRPSKAAGQSLLNQIADRRAWHSLTIEPGLSLTLLAASH